MSISRRVARPLLSGIFVAGGLDAVQHPETKAKRAETVAVPLAKKVSVLPQEPADLVRLNGAVQVGAGVLLAMGKFRRLAAMALIGSLIPTTIAGHRFWEETDEQAKKHERTQFFKNLALIGGLILAAVDTEGAPSLGWRAKRQARRTGRTLFEGRGRAERRARKAATAAAIFAQAGGGRAAKNANRAAARTAAKAQKAAERARQVDLRKAQERAAKAAGKASMAARQGAGVASEVLQSKAGQAGELLQARAGQAGELLRSGAGPAGELLQARAGQAGELLRSGAGQAGEVLQARAGQAGKLVARAAERLPVKSGAA